MEATPKIIVCICAIVAGTILLFGLYELAVQIRLTVF